MPGPYTPSRAASFSSQASPESQNAALLGANVAFARRPPKARQTSSSHVGTVGGPAAAAAAGGSGRMSRTPSPKHGMNVSPGAPVAPASPTGSVQSVRSRTGKAVSALDSGNMPLLAPPTRNERERSKSPSQKAAQVATARSPNPEREPTHANARAKTVQKPAVVPKPRRLSVHHHGVSDEEPGRPTDSSPTLPTTSLVNLFERKASDRDVPGRRPEPIKIKPSRDLAIQSPKPVRTPADGGITSVFQMELEEGKNMPKPATSTTAKDDSPSPHFDGPSSSDSYVSASEDNTPPSPSLTVLKRDSRTPSVSSLDPALPRNIGKRRPGPSPSPLRHSSTEPVQIHPSSRNTTSPPETIPASSQSTKSIAAQWHQLHPRRVTPLNTGDELANAIVASSLASSRAPSPRKLEPPPVPARRQKQHKLPFSRTPSPVKAGMRQTLRKAESEESETEDELHPYGKHKKKRLVRKHPNKHHEGDRKRWRDAVTERERKRYEGVWAANKGMCSSFTVEEERAFRLTPNAKWVKATQTAAADQVSNLVARDIWARSRLPEPILETVWDLVDNDGVGRLNKDEFVVGMWLIDQRLKGRKLPVRVTDSVWTSVRGVQGIKIRK